MWRAVVASIAVLAVLPARASQELPLDVVLKRAADYVGAYQKGLRGVVAEETYAQNMTSLRSGGLGGRSRIARDSRRLVSDLLLVQLPNEDRWMQFRDVFEVDRKPVRDREQRLYKLFVDAKPDAREQAEALQKESARYNLGPLMRTINVPMMALFIFDRNIHAGVEYEYGNSGNTKRFSDLAPAESVALVEFKEATTDTLIKGENGRDVPAHGRAWIDKTDGRILQTELIALDTAIRAQITVTYKRQEGIPVLVPDEMRETYMIHKTETRIDGRANYARFRQFTVSTTEKPKS
jgi:uncharacterized protein YbaR (Trm112 family)